MTRKILICGGLLLITAALCLTAYNIWDGRRAYQASEQVLEELLDMEAAAEPEAGADSASQASNAEMPTLTVDENEYIGTLEIPELELTLPVISEWNYDRLKIAPCRYKGSVYTDNLIIAAHNYDRHFGKLKDLPAGSAVIFTDVNGRSYEYAVSETEQLSGTSVGEMESGDWDLTLFTCTLGGKARVTLRCDKLSGSGG